MSQLSIKNIKKSIKKSYNNININTNNKIYSNKHIIIGSIVFLVCIISLYYIYKYFRGIDVSNGSTDVSGSVDSNNIKNMQVEVVKRPFLNLYAVKKDGAEVATNIVFITHSFTRDECETFYNEYKAKGIHFLGLSSYSEFPGPISNPHDALHDPKHKA